jgi:hypothetical protein
MNPMIGWLLAVQIVLLVNKLLADVSGIRSLDAMCWHLEVAADGTQLYQRDMHNALSTIFSG